MPAILRPSHQTRSSRYLDIARFNPVRPNSISIVHTPDPIDTYADKMIRLVALLLLLLPIAALSGPVTLPMLNLSVTTDFIIAVVAITDTTAFSLVVAGVFTVDLVASDRFTRSSLGGISAGDISLGLDIRRGFSDGIGESVANEGGAEKKGKTHLK